MSTLQVNTIQNTSGQEVYTAKAWVNFNGTGTVAIREAGNVSSITDNGTGAYTVNFTDAMVDANYSVSVSIGGPSGTDICRVYDENVPRTASLVKILTISNTFNFSDTDNCNVVIFR